ncbi:hypothetical protein I4U23_017069 [Adineta vaga]|nr:hypothetical protein I4U23_017069 [Adineta vaga]
MARRYTCRSTTLICRRSFMFYFDSTIFFLILHAARPDGQVTHKRDVLLVKITIGTFVAFVMDWIPSFVAHLFVSSAFIPTIVNYCL